MSKFILKSSSLILGSSSVLISPLRTSTPTITGMTCQTDTVDYWINVSVTNNDAFPALVEISTSSNFSLIDDSETVAAGATAVLQVFGYSSPPGSTTVYARATYVGGKLVSATTSNTTNLALCESV